MRSELGLFCNGGTHEASRCYTLEGRYAQFAAEFRRLEVPRCRRLGAGPHGLRQRLQRCRLVASYRCWQTLERGNNFREGPHLPSRRANVVGAGCLLPLETLTKYRHGALAAAARSLAAALSGLVAWPWARQCGPNGPTGHVPRTSLPASCMTSAPFGSGSAQAAVGAPCPFWERELRAAVYCRLTPLLFFFLQAFVSGCSRSRATFQALCTRLAGWRVLWRPTLRCPRAKGARRHRN